MSSTTLPSRSDAPPPPPPPPPRHSALYPVTRSLTSPTVSPAVSRNVHGEQTPKPADGKDKSASVFSWSGDSPETTEFDFPRLERLEETKGTVPLRTLVTHYVGALQSRKVAAEKLFMVLGRLRYLRHAIECYNTGLLSRSEAFSQYWRPRTLSLLSGLGFRPRAESEPIHIVGLTELVCRLESVFQKEIRSAKELIASGWITFDGLGELFRPGYPVKCTVVPGSVPCLYHVADTFYEERRTLFGLQKHFHVSMEVVVLVGDHFSVASFSEVFSAWSGVRCRSLADFAYKPVTPNEMPLFQARGNHAVTYGLGGAKYLAYAPHTFYTHTSRSRQDTPGLAQARNSSVSVSGGRIMIDMARGSSLGHYPCQGVDETTVSIIQLAGRYRQWLSKRSRSDNVETDDLILWESVPPDFVIFCWPALVGFSFTTKTWGHVLVDGLSSIDFRDDAFDHLVLDPERKKLLRAVVRQGTILPPSDLISGKQGGQIFLLHGPPGVGKTLTAEAIAEILHRPLYYVTMGELGVTPDDLERRLSDVLELCAEWNALAVLDEADVFLETRSNSDLIRNAMVCVMLRILEYHPGILFLTTNRVRTLDPAFESRITIALRYEALDRDARAQIWKSQVQRLPGQVSSDIDYYKLAEQPLNGRQIKNAARLALNLAADATSPLTESILLTTVEVVSLGHENILADNFWGDRRL
ncbi:P-loop containing nucleoside triphosphate hydrolase protein [Aspergillus novoparasiticus]|uniref:P-loop containing nucleoside triphosphate hydrolase protein n=1 Tax=Aspergillus novoparasiticus TaxID=986946 RepID=A0A5N6F0U2_9EURO|nr:P-loop containing nucleoside triphosphate hydrolase protein [Aspergillus novoparasiticus]